MPDFNHLTQQLHADVSDLKWPDPGQIRAAGSRRRRARVAAAVLAAAVAVAAAVLLPHAGPRQGPAPAASPAPTHASPTPPTTPANQAAAIPFPALLTAADFGSTFIAEESSFPAMYTPNPFLGCGPDGLPGAAPPAASLGIGFRERQGGSVAGDSVLRFAPGGAHRTMAAASDLMAGACAGHYQVLSRNLGGDESLLLHTADPAMVVPQAAHATAIYYAIVRKGDYLMWVTLINQTQLAGQATLATNLAHHAEQRLCAAVAC